LISLRTTVTAVLLLISAGALAQTPPPAAPVPAPSYPTFSIGGVIFADYTYTDEPKKADDAGNTIHPSSFNITRAYVNVTGDLSPLMSYRITPDIARESGSGSSLSGSYTYRLKYAYGQLNLGQWLSPGSWLRAGITQTPLIDTLESAYRYRFQGPLFVDREGYLSAADAGASLRYAFRGNYGDAQLGFYNGETYAHTETNNEKALQGRITVRPLPGSPIMKGLRLTAFYDDDHYYSGAPRTRFVAAATFEHPRVNAGIDLLRAHDRARPDQGEMDGRGWSAWVTPRLGGGCEALLRHDNLRPNGSGGGEKKRDITGIAYWLKLQKSSAAIMLDLERVTYDGFAPARPDERRIAVHTLLSF
jgi:hypothetical protein